MTEPRWTPEAIRDREAIYDYIEADNPIAALALDELVAEQAGGLVRVLRVLHAARQWPPQK